MMAGFRAHGVSMLLALTVGMTALGWLGAADDTAAQGLGPSDPPDPGLHAAARVQIVIRSIYVFDDADLIGPGEVTLDLRFAECQSEGCGGTEPGSEQGLGRLLLGETLIPFLAETGIEIRADRVVPGATDPNIFAPATVAFGIPLRANASYAFVLRAFEEDLFDTTAEYSAWKHVILTASNNWQLGRHRIQLLNDAVTGSGPALEIEYEIRLAPLPDLRPTGIALHDVLGTPEKLVCVHVENNGPEDAGPFQVRLLMNEGPVPNGSGQAGRLGAEKSGDVCTQVALPLDGRYTLSAEVDPVLGVMEQRETNNRIDQGFGLPRAIRAGEQAQPQTVVGPSGSPTPGKPDLFVESILIKASRPQGDQDCDPGKNGVIVRVRNQGTIASPALPVRLIVDDDDDDAKDVNLPALEPAKTADVTFEGVSLKKGNRDLTAIIDPKGTVGEVNENNNRRTVTIACKSEDD